MEEGGRKEGKPVTTHPQPSYLLVISGLKLNNDILEMIAV